MKKFWFNSLPLVLLIGAMLIAPFNISAETDATTKTGYWITYAEVFYGEKGSYSSSIVYSTASGNDRLSSIHLDTTALKTIVYHAIIITGDPCASGTVSVQYNQLLSGNTYSVTAQYGGVYTDVVIGETNNVTQDLVPGGRLTGTFTYSSSTEIVKLDDDQMSALELDISSLDQHLNAIQQWLTVSLTAYQQTQNISLSFIDQDLEDCYRELQAINNIVYNIEDYHLPLIEDDLVTINSTIDTLLNRTNNLLNSINQSINDDFSHLENNIDNLIDTVSFNDIPYELSIVSDGVDISVNQPGRYKKVTFTYTFDASALLNPSIILIPIYVYSYDSTPQNDLYQSLTVKIRGYDDRYFDYYILNNRYVSYVAIYNNSQLFSASAYITFYFNDIYLYRFNYSNSPILAIDFKDIEYYKLYDSFNIANIFRLVRFDSSGSSDQLQDQTSTSESLMNNYQSQEDLHFNDFNNSFQQMDFSSMNFSGDILSTAQWLSNVVQLTFVNIGDFKLLMILPLLLGVILFLIGRGSSVFRQPYEKPEYEKYMSYRDSDGNTTSYYRRKL